MRKASARKTTSSKAPLVKVAEAIGATLGSIVATADSAKDALTGASSTPAKPRARKRVKPARKATRRKSAKGSK